MVIPVIRTILVILTLIATTFSGYDTRLVQAGWGFRPTSFGDLNGDGKEDVVFANPNEDVSGVERAGAVYVYFGKEEPTFGYDMESGKLTGYDLRITGANKYDEPESGLGWMAALTDFDGDGYDDLIISEPFATSPKNSMMALRAGVIYIIYGKPSFANKEYKISQIRDAEFDGWLPERMTGYSFPFYPGDINGDGISDTLVMNYGGGPGNIMHTVSYIYGRNERFTGVVTPGAFTPEDGGNFIPAPDANLSIAGLALGDVNGDGYDDILIADINAPDGNIGTAYLYYGGTDFYGNKNLVDADAKFVGAHDKSRLGSMVICRDINNDGVDDIVIGANGSNKGNVHGGQVYIIKGVNSVFPPFAGEKSMASSSNYDASLYGETKYESFGTIVLASDINQDGYKELFVGTNLPRSTSVLGSIPDGGIYLIDGTLPFSGLKDKGMGDSSNFLAHLKETPEEPDDQDIGYRFYYGSGVDLNADGVKDLIFADFPTDTISSTVFMYYSHFPATAVLYPNGGEELEAGDTVQIKWTAAQSGWFPLIDYPITLSYSINSGASYTQIAASLPNNGTYSWTVPAVSSSAVRVRVSAKNCLNQKSEDASDADLTIKSAAPAVTLISPNGGEVFTGGSKQKIKWSAEGGYVGLAENPITIYYSTDGGANYPTVIASNIANSGEYEWTTPNVDQSDLKIKVKAINSVGQAGEDASDAVFSISRETGETPVISELRSGPSPYSPRGAAGISSLGAESAVISYSLSNSGDVKIFIFDSTGGLKWKKDITAGEEGGHVGANSVSWTGVDQNNSLLPNGVYIIKIVSGGKVIGTDKIIIVK